MLGKDGEILQSIWPWRNDAVPSAVGLPRVLRGIILSRARCTNAIARVERFSRGERLRVIRLCRSCHKQIHTLFTESELAGDYYSIEALAAHPEVARFVQWVVRQPPTAEISVRCRRC